MVWVMAEACIGRATAAARARGTRAFFNFMAVSLGNFLCDKITSPAYDLSLILASKKRIAEHKKATARVAF
jgi:hypothetical protein